MAIKVGVSTVSAALRKLLAEITAYINRVVSDGGTVVSESDANKVVKWLKQHGLLDSTELLYLSNAGLSIRDEAGNLRFIEKVYSLDQNATPNDGTQTTELNQPRLVGGIAPRAKVAFANQSGEARYFTHPEISFAATDAWSIVWCINWEGTQLNKFPTISGRHISGYGKIDLDSIGDLTYKISFTNLVNRKEVFNPGSSKPFLNKNTIGVFVAGGNNTLKLYINGNFIQSVSVDTVSTWSSIIRGYGYGTGREFRGKFHFYRIQSGAMTAAQVLAEYNLLRSMYPEIESTTIGSQVWATRNFEAVATPLGNVIANVTENGAVEKITNGSFDTDTGWIKSSGATIADGVAHLPAGTATVRQNFTTKAGWHKLSFDVTINTSGILNIRDYSTVVPYKSITPTAGTNTFYLKKNESGIAFTAIGDFDIDNVSLQELNWSNATEIYDAVYAATSDTAAEKEYAALKEAAMWCYYDNSADKGAIYGKLYNWYAAKLLDLDMASAGFGWRPTLDADWTELAPDSSDESLKYAGDDYWTTGNIADNSDKLTILGGGYRNENGYFFALKDSARVWNSDETTDDKRIGASIRLIKTE